MGVFTKASSVLSAAMAGDTSSDDGRPADGRPACQSRKGAEWGVLAEAADLRASAGKEAETGVVRARTGLIAGMLEARLNECCRGRGGGREEQVKRMTREVPTSLSWD